MLDSASGPLLVGDMAPEYAGSGDHLTLTWPRAHRLLRGTAAAAVALIFATAAVIGSSLLAAAATLAVAPAGMLAHTREYAGPLPWFACLALAVTAAGALVQGRRAEERRGTRVRTGFRVVIAVAGLWLVDQGAGLLISELLWPGSPRASLAARLALAAASFGGAGIAGHLIGGPLRGRILVWGALLASAPFMPEPRLVPVIVILAQAAVGVPLLAEGAQVALTGRRRAVRRGPAPAPVPATG